MSIRDGYGEAICLAVVAWGTLLSCGDARAQFDSAAPEPIKPLQGALVLHGGGDVPEPLCREFVRLAGESNAVIVVIQDTESSLEGQLESWNSLGAKRVVPLRADSRDAAQTPEFSDALAEATGVWFADGDAATLMERYGQTPISVAVRGVLDRGGVVGGTSSGAAICAAVMSDPSGTRNGLALLPGVVVSPRFSLAPASSGDPRQRLADAVKKNPGYAGMGIEEGTALIVRGRSLHVSGTARVVVYQPPSADRVARFETWHPGARGDLLAITRAAQARSYGSFPAVSPPPPRLARGRLVIVGGGGTPKTAMEKFVEFSGGENGRIVYIPCSEQATLPEPVSILKSFEAAGAKQVTWLHTKDRAKANDERFLQPLSDATGVWFGGGRQWNLVDSYQNTLAHRLMHAVLERGGVIGGSSAGASIQGDYMPRGDPLGNLVMMAEGYERGLGFLTGVAIDQHFRQRNRFSDMSQLTSSFPQLLGIGIDESTALIVEGGIANVHGRGGVAIYDFQASGRLTSDESSHYLTIRSGDQYDLAARKRVRE